jgi:signal transduction histidine kinase/ligand-binding sensor domain-containing protein/CheY-like chemotaxis protein
MRLIATLGALFLLAPGVRATRQIFDRDYVITQWTAEDGLPESSATSMIQTAHGFLLLGTFGGLTRWDGDRFRVVPIDDPALPNTGVVTLHEDNRGGIWVSTLSGVAQRDAGGWRAIPNPEGSWNDVVIRFESDIRGGTYMVTTNGRVLYGKGSAWRYLPTPPSSERRRYLLRDSLGDVCVASGTEVFQWSQDSWKTVASIDTGNQPVLLWGNARQGGWFAVTDDSVLRVQAGKIVGRARSSRRFRNVIGIYEDDLGAVWLASYDSGLYRVDPDGGVRLFDRAAGFPSSSIRFVVQDSWRNIWVGTNGDGLVRLRRRTFSSFGEESGLPDVPVKSLALHSDGSVFVATYGKGVYRLQDHSARPLFAAASQPAFTQALLLDSRKRLWIGSYSDGLWTSDSGPPRRIPDAEASGATIEALYEDRGGKVWIGGSDRAAVFENGEFHAVGIEDKKGPVPIAAFAEGENAMWAGGDGGLYRLSGGQFVPVKDRQGRRLPALRAILPSSGGLLWLGGVATGLLRFENGAIAAVEHPYGRTASIGAIDRHGEWLFISTTQGVWRVREADVRQEAAGGERQRWRLFGKDEGIPSIETSVGHQPLTAWGPDGRLWISTLKGVIVSSPSALIEDTSPAEVVVQSVSYRDSEGAEIIASRQPNGDFPMSPGSQDIHIVFTTTHQGAPERVLFSYQVENGDGRAAEVLTDRRDFRLFKLALGENRVLIRASNGDGVWSGEPVVLQLYQARAFWQKAWVRASAAVVSLALAGLAIYLWAVSRKRRYERELRQVMEAEAERKQLAEQLAQSQKMESVGRLAGGVAHDFNNLLTVINGYSSMVMQKLPRDDPRRRQLEQVCQAGERAAALTSQLLAFSRKQILQPRVLDLNRVVMGMHTMLRRLVGEDVELRLSLSTVPACVKADQHQLEQVIMNLAVNARDAMPRGGEIAIATQPSTLGEEEARRLPGVTPGRYIALSMRDNGTGMDEETRQRIFEPFFTTKGLGKGTGLGLSMVQGIVSQSGGAIDVESRPGAGTSFTIFLPETEEQGTDSGAPAVSRTARGSERVLIVEDQGEVRRFAADALGNAGFRVIEAAGVDEALRFFDPGSPPIDLVLCDIVMPSRGGRDLSDTLREEGSECPVLFMSGYSDDVIANQGVLREGVYFIEKPFSPADLVAKIRSVLDSRLP